MFRSTTQLSKATRTVAEGNNALQNAFNTRNWRKALLVLDEMDHGDCVTMYRGLRAAALAKKADVSTAVLQRLKKLNISFESPQDHGVRLKSLGFVNAWEESLRLLGTFPADLIHHNIVLKQVAKANYNRATALVREMERKGLQPDDYTHRTLRDVKLRGMEMRLAQFERSGDWQASMEYLRKCADEINSGNVTASHAENNRLIAAAIGACADAKAWHQALALLGQCTEPDTAVYNKVLSTLPTALNAVSPERHAVSPERADGVVNVGNASNDDVATVVKTLIEAMNARRVAFDAASFGHLTRLDCGDLRAEIIGRMKRYSPTSEEVLIFSKLMYTQQLPLPLEFTSYVADICAHLNHRAAGKESSIDVSSLTHALPRSPKASFGPLTHYVLKELNLTCDHFPIRDARDAIEKYIIEGIKPQRETATYEGVVRFFSPVTKYGFITSPSFPDDVFLHANEMKDHQDKLTAGSRVRFGVNRKSTKARAQNVRLADESEDLPNETDVPGELSEAARRRIAKKPCWIWHAKTGGQIVPSGGTRTTMKKFEALHVEHNDHAEKKALEELAQQLGNKNAGEVFLFTTRAPCLSCLAIFCQFQHTYPRLQLRVHYDSTAEDDGDDRSRQLSRI